MSPSSLPPPFPPTRLELWKQRLSHLFLEKPWLAVAVILGPALLAGLIILLIVRLQRPEARHLDGYISDVTLLQSEYQRYQGTPLKAEETERQFRQAAEWTARGDYGRAAQLLDSVSRQAPLPVVYNDLGVLYDKLRDPRHAINAFREALARDASYAPVRANLDRLHGLTGQVADPLATEAEPNDSLSTANTLAIDQPVEAEIKDTTDADFFRFTTPPPPRDRYTILIQNRSRTLAPHLRIYDRQQLMMPLSHDPRQAGESVEMVFSPEPNSTYYLNVFGDHDSFGAYTVTVKSLKSFDRFEPNDEIYSARKITVGASIDANIMDGDDTDFYSFEAPRTGTVSIDIENHSGILIPALTTFNSDMRTNDFGPDVHAGASVHHSMAVQQGQTYYVQVWAQGKTSGEYSLKIE